jgi:hypothetical protein
VDPTTPPFVVVRLQGPFSFVDMAKDKREETSPRQTQKVGEKDTHKRREEEREGAWACACHTALFFFFFFFFSSAAVCLSVWGFLWPLKTSSLSVLSLQKSFCLSHYLQFATSNPKKRKKKKKRLLQKFCSQSEVL